MSTAEYSGASFDGEAVTVDIEYDTSTFKVTAVNYQNLSAQNASVTFIDNHGHPHVFTLAANTQPSSADVSSLGLVMAVTTGINPKTGLQQTFVNLPAGWSISIAWPA